MAWNGSFFSFVPKKMEQRVHVEFVTGIGFLLLIAFHSLPFLVLPVHVALARCNGFCAPWWHGQVNMITVPGAE